MRLYNYQNRNYLYGTPGKSNVAGGGAITQILTEKGPKLGWKFLQNVKKYIYQFTMMKIEN